MKMDISLPEPHIVAIAQVVARHVFVDSHPPLIWTLFYNLLSPKEIKKLSFLMTGMRKYRNLTEITQKCLPYPPYPSIYKLDLSAKLGMMNWVVEFERQGVDIDRVDLAHPIRYNHLNVVEFLVSKDAPYYLHHICLAFDWEHIQIFDFLVSQLIKDREMLKWTLRTCSDPENYHDEFVLNPILDRIIKNPEDREWLKLWAKRQRNDRISKYLRAHSTHLISLEVLSDDVVISSQ